MRSVTVLVLVLLSVVPAHADPVTVVRASGAGDFFSTKTPYGGRVEMTTVGPVLSGSGLIGGVGRLRITPNGGQTLDLTVECQIAIRNPDGSPDATLIGDAITGTTRYTYMLVHNWFDSGGTRIEYEQFAYERSTQPPCLTPMSTEHGWTAIGNPIILAFTEIAELP